VTAAAPDCQLVRRDRHHPRQRRGVMWDWNWGWDEAGGGDQAADLEGTLLFRPARAFASQARLGQVLVDFTHPKGGMYEAHPDAAIALRVNPVIGTTAPQPEATGAIWPRFARRPGSRRHHSEFFRRHGAAPAGRRRPRPLLRLRRTHRAAPQPRRPTPQRHLPQDRQFDRGDRQKLSMPPQVERARNAGGCRGGQRETACACTRSGRAGTWWPPGS